MSVRWVIILAIMAALLCLCGGAKTKASSRSRNKAKAKSNKRSKKGSSTSRPPKPGHTFVLQSAADKWQCFAGDRFSHCGPDTLWYTTTGTSGFNFHLRPAEDATATTSDSCLIRRDCGSLDDAQKQLSLGSCSDACSAMKWGLEKEVKTDFQVITYNNTQYCAAWDVAKNSVFLDQCIDEKYTTMVQITMLKGDIAALNSTAQKLISLALSGEKTTLMELLGQKKTEVNARSWEDSTVLHAVAFRGDAELADHLINTLQADVNLHDRRHRTALMEAAAKGHLEVVKLLVAAGAEADSADSSGATPLMMAAENGQTSVVEFLLDQHSVDVNRLDTAGRHALHKACQASKLHTETVKVLLAAGAHVNTTSLNEGTSALFAAVEADSTLRQDTDSDTSVIKLLIESEAEVDSRDKDGSTPLMIAAYHHRPAIVNLLIAAGASVNAATFEGNVTTLMYAAAAGDTQICASLLKHGAEVHHKYLPSGGTALYEAVINGSLPIVKMLIEASADPAAVDYENMTSLHACAQGGFMEICELLLAKGLDVNAVASSGSTPLMHAVSTNQTDTVKLLLRHNANANVATNATKEYVEKNSIDVLSDPTVDPYEHEMTALMMASRQNLVDIAKMLVEAGANVNARDAVKLTPSLHAVSNNSFDVLSYLVQNGADPNELVVDKVNGVRSILQFAVVNNRTDLALLLLDKGANGSFADSDGVTVATHAAYLGNVKVVQELAARNADLKSGNYDGTDPLIAASAEGHYDVVAALLKSKSVNVHAADVDGTTALMAACVRGHKQVASLLVSAGASVNAQNVEGHNALMFAYSGKYQVEILLEKYRDYMKVEDDNSTRAMKEAIKVHSSIVTLLLRSGADTTITDVLGHVPKDFDSVDFKDEPEGSVGGGGEL